MLNPRFHGPKYRTFRTLAFVGTGLSGFAPLLHGISIFGFSQMMKQSGMPYYLIEGGFLLLGALVYAVSIPSMQLIGINPNSLTSTDQVPRMPMAR